MLRLLRLSRRFMRIVPSFTETLMIYDEKDSELASKVTFRYLQACDDTESATLMMRRYLAIDFPSDYRTRIFLVRLQGLTAVRFHNLRTIRRLQAKDFWLSEIESPRIRES